MRDARNFARRLRLSAQVVAGGLPAPAARTIGASRNYRRRKRMNGIIYIVGLVVVVGIILSFFGLR
jgi:hypothetical protein